MWELINVGGWVMAPIILSSMIALAIVLERLWVLRLSRIAPSGLIADLWREQTVGRLDASRLRALQQGLPLERIAAAALAQPNASADALRTAMEEAGRDEAYSLSRYLNTLGTVAAVSPLLGLLGTVFGMIEVFAAIDLGDRTNTAALAGGIGQALVTTGAGLSVAIPALVAHRYLRGRVQMVTQHLEREALRLSRLMTQPNRDQTESH